MRRLQRLELRQQRLNAAAAETQPPKAAAKSGPDTKAPPLPLPPKAEAPGAPAPTPKPKPKAKAKAMTDAGKAKTPCIFFKMPSGCMRGDNCKYNQEAVKTKAPPPPKPKPKDTAKAKSSSVTKAVVALVAASSLCTPAASAQSSFSMNGLPTLQQVGIWVQQAHCLTRVFPRMHIPPF